MYFISSPKILSHFIGQLNWSIAVLSVWYYQDIGAQYENIYLTVDQRSPLASQLIFLKVHAHGKFLHRVPREEGLGTSEL